MRRVARAIFSGFTAGIAMLATFLAAFGALRLAAPPAGALHNLVNNPLLDVARANLYEAFEIHTLIALTFAIVYALALEPRLSALRPAMKGVVASLVPWLASICLFLPWAGAGFLGLGLGAGLLPAVGNLVLHLVFGITLAVIYDGAADRSLERDAATNYDTDRVVLGGLKGLAGGVVIAVALLPFDLVPAAVAGVDGLGPYWLALFVTALGLLWGVLTGVSTAPQMAR